MLALTKKTEYALIALSHLAKRTEPFVSAREIAQTCGVSLPVLTNILKTLTNAGFVESTRGACGGYGLARSMASISLHELITTIEGPFQFVQCVLSGPDANGLACDLEPSCPIRSPAFKIYDRMRAFLDNVTLDELVDDGVPADAALTGPSAMAMLRERTKGSELNGHAGIP